MKNRKGFTLVEVLAVIVILGIITGISIPLIRNIREQNDNKKYKVYADSLTASSKLYIDNYSEDIFGHSESGCAYLTYEDLEEKGLLKDIEVDDVSCNSTSTFVKVVKNGDKYTYEPYLGCGVENNDSAQSITISYPEPNKVYSMDDDACGITHATITVDVDPFNDNIYAKRHKTYIVLTSKTGINADIRISAAWRQDQNYSLVSSWTPASFTIPTNQREKVNNGETIRIKSQEYVTPAVESGAFYLLIKV